MPDTTTLSNITGTWTMSRPLSTDLDQMMTLQGIGFLLRKASKIGNITLKMLHDNTASPETVTVTLIPPGGFASTTKERICDGERRVEKTFEFGEVGIGWRRIRKGEIGDGFLREGRWVDGEDGLFEDVIEKTDGSWVSTGIWGIVKLDDGCTYLAKRCNVVTKDGKRTDVQMIYEAQK